MKGQAFLKVKGSYQIFSLFPQWLYNDGVRILRLSATAFKETLLKPFLSAISAAVCMTSDFVIRISLPLEKIFSNYFN